jgi:MtaA/CmuA family methyltransferase
MNAMQRTVERLHGAPVDRAPNFAILMAYAAHHIGANLSRYFLDYRTLCAANFAMVEDFDLDILQAISDPYREAADWGLPVEFPQDDLPARRSALILEPEDLKKLPGNKPEGGRRMSDRVEAVRLFHQQAKGQVPVMGWVEGSLAEAADLRGVSEIMTDLYDRPEWTQELLERCLEVEIAFAQAQVEAGADIIGLGDAVASQIAPKMYRKFALPYEQRIFAAVHEMGALARLHICGDTSRILSAMAESGADIIDVDWMVDYAQAAAAFENSPTRPAVCGNFDPVQVMRYGTPAGVLEAVSKCLQSGGSRCYIAAGCEIPDGTPVENMKALAAALKEYSG